MANVQTPVTPEPCSLYTDLETYSVLIACLMCECLVYMTLDWSVGRAAAAA